VALKVYAREEVNQEEFKIYQYLSRANPSHPGYPHVRTALDTFTIRRPGGDHHCLVQNPMWESFRDLLYRNPTHRFTEDLLRAGLMQVFLALDYLHTECKLVHTGAKDSGASNSSVANTPSGRYQRRQHPSGDRGQIDPRSLYQS
jgi:serine/threonine-protein kinase SRPK3